jgi:hypothetical protein
MQTLGVREDLVQSLTGVEPRIAREPDRKIAYGIEFLDLDALCSTVHSRRSILLPIHYGDLHLWPP